MQATPAKSGLDATQELSVVLKPLCWHCEGEPISGSGSWSLL